MPDPAAGASGTGGGEAEPVLCSADDAAMVAFLLGDDVVIAAARKIWNATTDLLAAQRVLEAATDTYRQAVGRAGIPSEHVERIGASCLMRLTTSRLLGEPDAPEHPAGGDMP